MTQCHARISRENLPVPLKLEKIIIIDYRCESG